MSMKRTILTWGPIVGAVSITLMLATLALADRIGFGHSEKREFVGGVRAGM